MYKSLGLPVGCIEAGRGLRIIYQRHLESFERSQRMTIKTVSTEDQDVCATHESDIQVSVNEVTDKCTLGCRPNLASQTLREQRVSFRQ